MDKILHRPGTSNAGGFLMELAVAGRRIGSRSSPKPPWTGPRPSGPSRIDWGTSCTPDSCSSLSHGHRREKVPRARCAFPGLRRYRLSQSPRALSLHRWSTSRGTRVPRRSPGSSRFIGCAPTRKETSRYWIGFGTSRSIRPCPTGTLDPHLRGPRSDSGPPEPRNRKHPPGTIRRPCTRYVPTGKGVLSFVSRPYGSC